MSSDEPGAPWPYAALPPRVEHDASPPSWECPQELCVCHPPDGAAERVEHRVLFFDHEAKRMPGARCRVLEGSVLLNTAAPFADAAGAVTVEVRPGTHTLELEWAPAELPRAALFPFRRQYYRDLGEGGEDGVRRRLHNIGFSSYGALEDNVRDFQRTYRKVVTGRHEDIAAELAGYHDAGALPPVPSRSSDAPSTEASSEASPVQHRLVQDGHDPGPVAPPGGGPPPVAGPPAPGGPQPQGTAAAISATRLCVELHTAFALDPTDLEQIDAVAWDDPPYDIPKLFSELYPNPSKRTWRFAARGDAPVVGARLTIDELGVGKATATTNERGEAVFELTYPSTVQNLIAVRVEPAPGQLNTTGAPAGPRLTDKDTTAAYLFRPFQLYLGLDPTGALLLDQCMIIDKTKPRFARIIESSKQANKQIKRKVRKGDREVTELLRVDNLIVIDWKPDWMRSHESKSRSPRYLDGRDVPINPFDESIPRARRLAESAPGVVIHETSTHNLSFLPGFLKSTSSGVETSIHYVVDYDGFVIKTIDEHYRSNHGGETVWRQRVGLNHFTVGIETMHVDTTPPAAEGAPVTTPRRFTREQYDALIRLLRELRSATVGYPILRRMVVGHLDVKLGKNQAPQKAQGVTIDYRGTLQGKPTCPGPMFDWQRLEEAGVALAPASADGLTSRVSELRALHDVTSIKRGSTGTAVKAVKQLLFDIGYAVTSQRVESRDLIDDKYDGATEGAILAFQRRYFSARRRTYKLVGTGVLDRNKPKEGTLDQETISAMIGVWWSARATTD